VVEDQLTQRGGAPNAVEQRLAGEGLFKEIVGAGTDGLDGELNVTVAGDQQDRQLTVNSVQLLLELKAIDARHADVADHDAGPVRRQQAGQPARIAQAEDLEPGEVECLAQGHAQVRIVVDQDYLNVRV